MQNCTLIPDHSIKNRFRITMFFPGPPHITMFSKKCGHVFLKKRALRAHISPILLALTGLPSFLLPCFSEATSYYHVYQKTW